MQGLEQLQTNESLEVRSLSPNAAHRVILRLTSYEMGGKLSRDKAWVFNHVLRGEETGKSDFEITVREGSYYLDFTGHSVQEDMRSTLRQSVDRTARAVYASKLPAAVVQAWVVAANAPHVSELYPEDWATLEPIHTSATEMFERAQSEVVSADIDAMLWEPDFS